MAHARTLSCVCRLRAKTVAPHNHRYGSCVEIFRKLTAAPGRTGTVAVTPNLSKPRDKGGETV